MTLGLLAAALPWPSFAQSRTIAAEISAGSNMSCARTRDDAVLCWGSIKDPALTNATGDLFELAPVPIVGWEQGIRHVVAGSRTACASTADGRVSCRGDNEYGETGTAGPEFRALPIAVETLGSQVSGIDFRSFIACAVTASAEVACWGAGNDYVFAPVNEFQETLPFTRPPTLIPGFSGSVAEVAMGRHACARMWDGSVECWGDPTNDVLRLWLDAQLGWKGGPLVVPRIGQGNRALAVGQDHACVITLGHGVKCWGQNLYGQAGHPDRFSDTRETFLVEGIGDTPVEIGAGANHTCVRTLSGVVKCWGENVYGQLGNGTNVDSFEPVTVVGLPGRVVALSVGAHHNCVLLDNAPPHCWGNNPDGRLGNGSRSLLVGGQSPRPVLGFGAPEVRVPGAPQIGEAVAGNGMAHVSFSAPIDDGGSPITHYTAVSSPGGRNGKCRSSPCIVRGLDNWRTYSFTVHASNALGAGQASAATNIVRATPVSNQEPVSEVVQIAAGFYHTCARTAVGGVHCWGDNRFGQLGDGTLENRASAANVEGLGSGVDWLDAEGYHTCAVLGDGSIKCWGWNENGRLGTDSLVSSAVPVDVVGLAGAAKQVALGGGHSCALLANEEVQCWGYGPQVGEGGVQDRWTPTRVLGPGSGVTRLFASDRHTCSLDQVGETLCWGFNGDGQIGDGTTVNRLLPQGQVGLGSVKSMGLGWFFSCAVDMTGTASCWGANYFGQLGDGSLEQRQEPTAVVGISGRVQRVAGGYGHACAVVDTGDVQCWGNNSDGALGDGTRVSRASPAQVHDLGGMVVDLSLGGDHACALMAFGGVTCWGRNQSGQLGEGTTITAMLPQSLLAPARVIFVGDFEG
jgi:alpha-tubulin suppressor-like RCC1 family protein